ncbi:LOW QUALITY PROTEIN: interleukin-9 receptor-like [Equus quagga]|uniref:LOW QUALITY PROTEIN: interleukin-9 receptor-like n=1 Tax=Equus quagga TaxID=89248 RepID=UPI001EE20392|nr:LOW QUALITY PROTEIN: interleukin-9 receptor-like [Equus quagga]
MRVWVGTHSVYSAGEHPSQRVSLIEHASRGAPNEEHPSQGVDITGNASWEHPMRSPHQGNTHRKSLTGSTQWGASITGSRLESASQGEPKEEYPSREYSSQEMPHKEHPMGSIFHREDLMRSLPLWVLLTRSPSGQSLAGWTWESEALTRETGTWLLICTCISTWVGLGVSVPGEGGGLGAGTFTCLTNNVLRIDCHWAASELGQGASPWLLFTSNHAPGSVHKCVFRASVCTLVLPPEEVLVPSDNFTITFHRDISGKEQVSLVDPQYLPRRHVKLDPPSDLQSNVSSDSCVLTWSITPALEPLTSLLTYELAFKRQEEAWERARHKDRIVGVTRLILEAVELDPGTTCEARLRVQMATAEDDVAEEDRYEGQWSEWSQPVRFPSPQRRGPLIPPLRQPDSTLVAVSIFLLLTSLTYLLFKLSPRVKRTFYQNVPSPVTFFQPLYSVHNGNFQSWTGAHRAGLQLSQDYVGAQRGALEPGIQEDIALLTYDPAHPWQSVGLEEAGIGTGLPVEWRGQLPAYLPQEDWVPVGPARPAPPQPEGSSSDYCALGCYGGCHPSTFPGSMQSSGPTLALACGHSCDQQSLDAQHGGAHVGAGHGQTQDPGEQLHEDLQGICSLLPLADSRLSLGGSRALTWPAESCPFWGKQTKVSGHDPLLDWTFCRGPPVQWSDVQCR